MNREARGRIKSSDMFKRGEKGENAPPSSMSGGKRLSMTPQSAAKESPKKLTEASPGKTEKVITKATSPSRIPDVKKVPTPGLGDSTRREPENRRP